MLKINTFNKLLAERSLDSHMLWKGALLWDLNNVKKAFHLNNNQLIMIISQCRIQGRGPGGPGPLISGSGWPVSPPYVKVWIRHSALEGGKAGKMTRELLDDTIARRKGQDEWCAQNRRTLAEREAAFSILAQVFSFSFLYISTEPAPQAYPLWNVSVEKRHMPVHRCFFPSKYINKQPNKMARFAGCLREDISNETHQSGPDFENMDDAVSLYRKFQGTLFQ